MFVSDQEVEDAETEQIEGDADVSEVVETRQHANAETETANTAVTYCSASCKPTPTPIWTTLHESINIQATRLHHVPKLDHKTQDGNFVKFSPIFKIL